MATISQTIFSDAFSLMEFFFGGGVIKISVKVVLKRPVDNNPVLVRLSTHRCVMFQYRQGAYIFSSRYLNYLCKMFDK